MTFLLELRDAAKRCSHKKWRQAMIDAADPLSHAIDAFVFKPSRENLTELNSRWAYAERVLKRMPPEGTPDPLSGAPEATVFKMARAA